MESANTLPRFLWHPIRARIPIEMMADEDLLLQARAASKEDSRSLIEELFSRYTRKVALWCLRLTGNTDEAADLAQDVMLAAYQDLDSFRGDCRFSTWLYTVMRNRFLNERRGRRSRPLFQAQELPEDLVGGSQEFVGQLAEAQQRDQLQSILRHDLNETERSAMAMHYGDEMTLDAITRVLGLTNESGAKAYIVSARRKIQRAMQRRTRSHKGGR